MVFPIVRLSVISLVLTGCTALPQSSDPVSIEDGGLYIYHTDREKRLLYIKDTENRDSHRLCFTPPGDAVSGFSEGVDITGISKLGLGFGEDKGELALGGRSPSVLIVRELLYRACELTSNLNTDEDTTLKIYKRFLQTIEQVSANQQEVGSATADLKENSRNSQSEIDASNVGGE